MPNPLYQMLGGGKMQGVVPGFQKMMQQFKQFQSTFQGDPKAEVQKLLQSVGWRNLQRLRLRLTTKHFSFFVNPRKWSAPCGY